MSSFTGHMKFRKFTIQDAKRVADLVGDEDVSRWTTNIPFPYTEQDAIEWIERTPANTGRHPFAVEIDDEIVACISYWPSGEDAIEVGYWVGKPYWGKGICTQALSMLMSQDFFPREKNVITRVMEGNIGSERVLEKCGFKSSGSCTANRFGEDIKSKFFVLEGAP